MGDGEAPDVARDTDPAEGVVDGSGLPWKWPDDSYELNAVVFAEKAIRVLLDWAAERGEPTFLSATESQVYTLLRRSLLDLLDRAASLTPLARDVLPGDRPAALAQEAAEILPEEWPDGAAGRVHYVATVRRRLKRWGASVWWLVQRCGGHRSECPRKGWLCSAATFGSLPADLQESTPSTDDPVAWPKAVSAIPALMSRLDEAVRALQEASLDPQTRLDREAVREWDSLWEAAGEAIGGLAWEAEMTATEDWAIFKKWGALAMRGDAATVAAREAVAAASRKACACCRLKAAWEPDACEHSKPPRAAAIVFECLPLLPQGARFWEGPLAVHPYSSPETQPHLSPPQRLPLGSSVLARFHSREDKLDASLYREIKEAEGWRTQADVAAEAARRDPQNAHVHTESRVKRLWAEVVGEPWRRGARKQR